MEEFKAFVLLYILVSLDVSLLKISLLTLLARETSLYVRILRHSLYGIKKADVRFGLIKTSDSDVHV